MTQTQDEQFFDFLAKGASINKTDALSFLVSSDTFELLEVYDIEDRNTDNFIIKAKDNGEWDRIMNPRKTITLQDVQNVALSLMKKNGKTTNLEVKNELRQQGFFAEQSTVRSYMNQLAEDLNWNQIIVDNSIAPPHNAFEDNSLNINPHNLSAPLNQGATRTGYISGPFDIAVAPGNQTLNNLTRSYTRRDGQVVNTKLNAFSGDWKVYSISSNEELYFDGSFTRDQVRQAYSNLCQIDFVDTRSYKI